MSIKINIQGTIFETTETTLKKINYFKYLFEDTNITINDIPFVDRPSHIFKHVLAYVIDDKYNYPMKYASELDFYDVNYDINKLYNPSSLINKCENNIIKQLNYKIDELENKLKTFRNDMSEQMNYKINNLKTCIKALQSNNSNICERCDNNSVFRNLCKDHLYDKDYIDYYNQISACKWKDCDDVPIKNNCCKNHIDVCDYVFDEFNGHYYCGDNAINFNGEHYRCNRHY